MRFAARKIRKILGNAVAPPIGLLIASASGEETRADIKARSQTSATESVSAPGKSRRAQPGLTENKNAQRPLPKSA